MVDEFAPLNLRARLDALQDRIVQARTALETHGIIGDQLNTLTEFVDQHDAIRGSLDTEGTVTELQHGKASARTDALENALDHWLSGIESKFNAPPARKPTASV
jgi:hypothetical protein